MSFNEWVDHKVTGFAYGLFSTILGSVGLILAFLGFILFDSGKWIGTFFCFLSPILLVSSGYLFLKGQYHSDFTPVLRR